MLIRSQDKNKLVKCLEKELIVAIDSTMDFIPTKKVFIMPQDDEV